MNKDQDITRVIFKKDRCEYHGGGWEIFACLLDIPANPGYVVTYTHVGQHSDGDISYCANCKRATVDEYMPLFEELESLGYNLKVVHKFQHGGK
jgi:hypothetical protein